MKSSKICVKMTAISIIILGSFSFSLFYSLSATVIPKIDEFQYTPNVASYSNHAPINITGDAELTLANGVSQGDGSALNPYIIEDLIISDKLIFDNGILIRNTTKYVLLRNIVLNNTSGIFLSDCRNIFFENCIINNTFSLNRIQNFIIRNCSVNYEIFVDTGNSFTIENNRYGLGTIVNCSNFIINYNRVGYDLYSGTIFASSNCTNAIISNNQIKGNGNMGNGGIRINGDYVQKNNNNTNIAITNNSIYESTYSGIDITHLNNSIIENNTINTTQKGILSWFNFNISISTNIITNCTIDGVDINENAELKIEKNEISNCVEGIRAINLNLSNIKFNTIKNCSENGFELVRSCNNSIQQNNITFNKIGLKLYSESKDNFIWGNNFSNNTEYQVWVNMTSNASPAPRNSWFKAIYNSILEDAFQVEPYFFIGNFFSDFKAKYPTASNDGFIWSRGNDIDGISRSYSPPYSYQTKLEYDPFPLVNPYSFQRIESPILQSLVELYNGKYYIHINWSLVPNAKYYGLFLSSICTTNISDMNLIRKESNVTSVLINQIFDNSTGTFTNSVPIGTYYFAIVAYNPLGVFSEPTICVKINVADTITNDTPNTNNESDPDLPSWSLPAIIAGGGIIGICAALIIYKRKQTFHF